MKKYIILLILLMMCGVGSANIVDNFDDEFFNTSLWTWKLEPSSWDEGTTRADNLYVNSTRDVSIPSALNTMDGFYGTNPYENPDYIIKMNDTLLHDTYEGDGIYFAVDDTHFDTVFAYRGGTQTQISSRKYNESSTTIATSESMYNYDCDELYLRMYYNGSHIVTMYKNDVKDWTEISAYVPDNSSYATFGTIFTAKLTSPLSNEIYIDSISLSEYVEPRTIPTNLYVSPTGSDSNDGLSSENAFLTLTYAESQMIEGDILNIAAGEYLESVTFDIDNINVIGAGSNTIIDLNTGDFITNSNYSTFAGLNISNGGDVTGANVRVAGHNNQLYNIISHDAYYVNPTSMPNGFSIAGDYTFMNGCENYNNGWNGLAFTGASNVFVTNHYSHDEYKHGLMDLYGSCDNITVVNSRLENTTYSGFYSHSLGHIQTNINFSNNYLYNVTGIGFQSDESTLSNSIITNNIFVDIDKHGIYATQYGTNNIISNNTIESNIAGGYYATYLAGIVDQIMYYDNNTLINSKTYRFDSGGNNGQYFITDDNSTDSFNILSNDASHDIYLKSTLGQFYSATFGNSVHDINGNSYLNQTSPTADLPYTITKSEYGCYPELSNINSSGLTSEQVTITSSESQNITFIELTTGNTSIVNINTGDTIVLFSVLDFISGETEILFEISSFLPIDLTLESDGTETFSITLSNSSTINWYLDDILVDTDTGLTSTYIFDESTGVYEVKVVVGELSKTWTVNVGSEVVASTSSTSGVSSSIYSSVSSVSSVSNTIDKVIESETTISTTVETVKDNKVAIISSIVILGSLLGIFRINKVKK